MYSNIQILMFKLEFIQDTLDLINKILFSNLLKENSINMIKDLLKKIHRVSEINNIIDNI